MMFIFLCVDYNTRVTQNTLRHPIIQTNFKGKIESVSEAINQFQKVTEFGKNDFVSFPNWYILTGVTSKINLQICF